MFLWRNKKNIALISTHLCRLDTNIDRGMGKWKDEEIYRKPDAHIASACWSNKHQENIPI